MNKRFWVLLLALALAVGLLSAVSVVSARRTASQAGSSEWTTIFSDTFTTTEPAWTFEDPLETETGYQWGVVSYTRMLEGSPVEDRGLWAAGGGSLGEAQSWATGTYTNNMVVEAVAGPFTLTQPAVSLRLTTRVLNQSISGDELLIEISPDGKRPADADPVPIDAENWQSITRTLESLGADETVFVYLRFASDGEGVDTGPLIDDIQLEMLAKHDIYLPLVRLDPTPTPPPIFHDDFSDPESGWFTGWVQRYNKYTDRYGDDHEGWEDVAKMSYKDGTYQIYVPLTWHGFGEVDTWFVWPAEMAPLPDEMKPIPENYCIETRGRIANEIYVGEWSAPDLAHWGIVFGANENGPDGHPSEIYTFQINSRGNLGIVGFHRYIYPGDRDHTDPDNIEWPIYRWPGNESYRYWSWGIYGNPPAEYTTLRVEVSGSKARFYVNSQLVATENSDNIGLMPRAQIGLIGGPFENTPVEIEFDYFHYEPNCAAP